MNVESEIRIARKKLKLSKAQLASLVYVSEKSISEYENRKEKIPDKVIKRLKELFCPHGEY